MKRLCSYDQEKNDPIICEEINDFTDEEQANLIAEHFALPRNKYSALQPSDIQVPSFLESLITQFNFKLELERKTLTISPIKETRLSIYFVQP